jgi:hypothetical protein
MKSSFLRGLTQAALTLALIRPGVSQIKIGRVAGTGNLTAATGVVFAADNSGFLSNPVSGLIQKFRSKSGDELARLQLTAGLGAIALSPDGRTLAVIGVTAQKVYLINAADLALKKEFSVTGSGFTSRTNPVFTFDSARVLVADPARNGVEVITVVDGSHERLIAVGINPTLMTVAPNGRQVGLLCSGKVAGDEESLYMIDMQTLSVIETARLPADTEAFNNVEFIIEGRNTYLVVGAYNNNRLQVLTLNSTGAVVGRALAGRGPSRISRSPNGRYVAVIDVLSKSVDLLNAPELTVLRSIPLDDSDFTVDSTLVFTPDSRSLLIPSLNTRELFVYDVEGLVEGRTIRKRVTVGERPVTVVVDRDGVIASTVNTGSNELALVALNPTTLYVPHLVQSGADYSGLAVANFDPVQAANVVFVARDNAGTVISASANPATVTVGAGKQLSMTTSQIFGFNTSSTIGGWVEAYTLGTNLGVLYLSGNTTQTQLDGFLANGTTAKRLGFSRITEGVSRFGSSTSTEIILANPSETTASIVSRLYGNNLEGVGRLLSHVTRQLQPHSRIRLPISQLHPDVAYPLSQGYLEVSSEDVAIQGMEVVKIGDSIAMIQAHERGLPDTTFFAVQFATGGSGLLDTPIFTNVSFANVSPVPITFTLQVTDENGAILPAGSRPVTKTLQPYEVLQGDADAIFNFPSPLSEPALYTGTLKVTAEQSGLIGDVVFGDARDGRYLSSLSLGLQPATSFGLVHFAEGKFGEPAKGLYTGLAMYNGNRAAADVTVEAYSPAGALLGKTEIRLESGKRLSRTIPQIVEGLTQQNGGTLKVKSTSPIYLFEVFGSTESEFLAAVPPISLP